jgi:hypothetical protein
MKNVRRQIPNAPKHSLRRKLAMVACAGLTALTAPKLMNIAHAEQATVSDFRFTVSGESARMSEGEDSQELSIVSRQLGHHPQVEIEGPATLTITFHPAVLREWFGQEGQEISRTVRYRMQNGGEGREQVFSGDVSLSEATSPDIPRMVEGESGEEVLNPLAIGTPITETIEIPEGMHTITIVAPNGLVSFDAQPIEREPEPVVEVPEPVVVEPEPPPAVVEEHPEPQPQRRISFLFDGHRSGLNFIGSHGSSGDINDISATVDAELSRGFGLVAGVSFTSYGLSYPSDLLDTDTRTCSVSLIAGASYTRGRHSLHAAALLGYDGIFTDAVFMSDGERGSDAQHLLRYGGEFGYRFGDLLRLDMRGGSDPFMPFRARIYGALPWGYGHGRQAHAWAQLDLAYMQMPVALENGNGEAIEIREPNLYGRLMAGVPVWAFRAGRGTIIPTILLGGDLNASSEGFHSIDMQLGAALEARAGGFGLQAGATVSPFSTTPMFLLRAGYRR